MQILYQLFAINLKHLLTLRLPRVSSVIHLRFRNHSKLSSFLLHEITSRIHCPQMLPPEPVLVSAVGTVLFFIRSSLFFLFFYRFIFFFIFFFYRYYYCYFSIFFFFFQFVCSFISLFYYSALVSLLPSLSYLAFIGFFPSFPSPVSTFCSLYILFPFVHSKASAYKFLYFCFFDIFIIHTFQKFSFFTSHPFFTLTSWFSPAYPLSPSLPASLLPSDLLPLKVCHDVDVCTYGTRAPLWHSFPRLCSLVLGHFGCELRGCSYGGDFRRLHYWNLIH